MYSGSTVTPLSGRVLGAHQKIDRVARKHLSKITHKSTKFPTSRQILHFEGYKGPDALKRKSPAQNEPWHYYSPFDENDSQLIELISDHYNLLVKQLRVDNRERAAFEAAWLAHAIVDGLTPAHHYPYEEKLTELRGGRGLDTRNSVKEKIILPGSTKHQRVKNNWKVWGPKGLMTTHGLFEFGIATLIAPLTFSDSVPTKAQINQVMDIGVIEWFKRSAREIAVLDLYDRYYKRGWTTKLSLDVRHKLAPTIIRAVALAWYLAMVEAKLVDTPS